MIGVKIVKSNKKAFLDLLLLADESEFMIDKYLERGELFALYDGDLKSVCVVTKESDNVCELKNIATYEEWHGKGYGSKLLNYIFSHYKGKYATMIVGTGDVPKAIRFYERNGFEISHRIKNFFTDNYEHPMFEDGFQLVDMVYLKRNFISSVDGDGFPNTKSMLKPRKRDGVVQKINPFKQNGLAKELGINILGERRGSSTLTDEIELMRICCVLSRQRRFSVNGCIQKSKLPKS